MKDDNLITESLGIFEELAKKYLPSKTKGRGIIIASYDKELPENGFIGIVGDEESMLSLFDRLAHDDVIHDIITRVLRAKNFVENIKNINVN